jgi:glycogen phosphorylase
MNESTGREALDGTSDMARAARELAEHMPSEFAGLARLAYNYWWSWSRDGEDVFRAIDAVRWEDCGANPVRLLQEVAPHRLIQLAANRAFVGRVAAVIRLLDEALAQPTTPSPASVGHPAAFLCAEFGVHESLPTYAGGLGVLAGDFLKEASDQALPVIGVGLFYSEGSFRQRIDETGWQHEYWTRTDKARIPCALVTGPDGQVVTVTVPIRGRDVMARVWRVNVGRVPLYLLDTDIPGNAVVDRWITARLYDGDRETRLAQYAVLGIGGMRALAAMGIAPTLLHLNEGHAALAAIEMIREGLLAGSSFEESLATARGRLVFATHTPVAAGNDSYAPAELAAALGDLKATLGVDPEWVLRTGRVHPEDNAGWFCLTAFALRVAGWAHGVSARHEQTARRMWRDVRREGSAEPVPIGHVTNGVHLPTWMAPEMRALLDRYLEHGWDLAGAPADVWERVRDIPAEEIWEVRGQLRRKLVAYVREQSVWNRLGRGLGMDYAQAAARNWGPDTLTVGFARRIAVYKRLSLLSADPARGVRLIGEPNPLQLVLAGKAHPRDEEAKRSVQRVFALDHLPGVTGRVAFLGDYDLATARPLVQGCDLWVNLPRPPQEASGTSGMKSALNGGLQLSVLDGWWAEAFDGANGWGIPGDEMQDEAEQDRRDAAVLFDLLENEVVPAFYTRGADGLPQAWVERIRASLITVGAGFTAGRMVQDYVARFEAH